MMKATIEKMQKLWSGLRRTFSSMHFLIILFNAKPLYTRGLPSHRLLQEMAELQTLIQISLGPGT